MSRNLAVCLGVLWLLSSACAADEEPSDPDGTPTPTGATPVAATDFCDKLAEIACSADASCCTGDEASSGEWPGGDGEADPPSCEVTQVAACRATVGELVTDPRTGYDPALGGEFVSAVASASEGCWKTPISYAGLRAAFRGTGEPGANCTPDDTSLPALRTAALSCKSGTSCRLYLHADGSPSGVCEKPSDDGCSHPYDCENGQWCDLPGNWKPGIWGQCYPVRSDGWSCASDLECASSHCDSAGECAPFTSRRFCLTTPYGSEVLADEPLAFLRLGESAGSVAVDASGNGNSGERVGEPGAVSPGALVQDLDSATSFDGLDDRVSVPAASFDELSALTIELWMFLPEGTLGKPLVTFGSAVEPGPSIAIDGEGRLRADLVDMTGESHVLDGGDAPPAAGGWHHVVVSYDGYHAALYLDGALVDQLDAVFSPRVDGALDVGFAPPDVHYNGMIDELAVYGAALTPGRVVERNQIGQHGPNRTWPVYRWFE